jgi:hypothetical protein
VPLHKLQLSTLQRRSQEGFPHRTRSKPHPTPPPREPRHAHARDSAAFLSRSSTGRGHRDADERHLDAMIGRACSQTRGLQEICARAKASSFRCTPSRAGQRSVAIELGTRARPQHTRTHTHTVSTSAQRLHTAPHHARTLAKWSRRPSAQPHSFARQHRPRPLSVSAPRAPVSTAGGTMRRHPCRKDRQSSPSSDGATELSSAPSRRGRRRVSAPRGHSAAAATRLRQRKAGRAAALGRE